MIIIHDFCAAVQPDLTRNFGKCVRFIYQVFLAGMSWWLILALQTICSSWFIPIMWLYLMHDLINMLCTYIIRSEKDLSF